MAMRKIVDQYTDLNLTASQRYRLRHPNRNKKMPFRVEAIKSALIRKNMNLAKHQGVPFEGEIRDLLRRGKAPVDIAMWYHLPMSVVSSVRI